MINRYHLVHTRDKLVLDHLAVLDPVVAVLQGALFKVAAASVHEDAEEENGIEHGDGGVEACAQTPCEGLDPVGGVVDLASVLPPSVDEKLVAVLCLDVFGVLKVGAWNDGERIAGFVFSLLLHLERRFLSHRTVEDRVAHNQSDEHCNLADEGELVRRCGAADHVDDGVAVGEGAASQSTPCQVPMYDSDLHSSHVPEDQHPAKLLVEHVPCLRDHLLPLGAGVDVETSSEEHVEHAVGDGAHLFVLLDDTREGDEEEEDPWNADLGEHLEVDDAEAGVERDAHEVVVDPVSAQAHGLASPVEDPSANLDDGGACEGGDDSHGHDGAVVLNDPWKAVDTRLVQDKREDETRIPRCQRVTLVRQGLVVERRNGQAFLGNTGEVSSEGELDDEKTEVGLPCECSGIRALLRVSHWSVVKKRATYLVCKLAHALKEWLDVVERGRVHKLALVVPQADEQIVWCQADYHCLVRVCRATYT